MMKTINQQLNTTTKRAVLYCRVSTKEQVEEGNSLSTQEKMCREYAVKNGYDIADVFVEQGESAKTADRTELKRLLNYCADKKNNVSAVIAYKIDRISRNTDDYSQIRILLKRYGVEIKSTSEHFENTPAGRFMENIIANVAQFDNDVRAERSINGMRDAVREGRYVWMAPIGYNNVSVHGKSTIAQNPLMAPIMKKVFTLVAMNQIPLERIWKVMSKEGLTNKAGKPLSRGYFYWMLKNELYCGWVTKFGERHKGLFEPIVSDELFNQVQQVLKHRIRRNHHYIWENPDFPLRRFIFHPSGKKLTGSWAKGTHAKYPYYRFLGKGTNYKRDVFEKYIKAYMNYFKFNQSDFNALKGELHKSLGSVMQNQQKESETLKQAIAELNKKQNLLIRKNCEGVITDALLQQQLEIIEKDLLQLNTTLACIPQTNLNVNFENLLNYIRNFLQHPGECWEKAKPELKVRLQWFQFPKGISFDGEKFQTTEIANIFNVKSNFLADLSYTVPLRNLITNESISKKIRASNKYKDNKGRQSTVYWEQIKQELITLSSIIHEIEAEKQIGTASSEKLQR